MTRARILLADDHVLVLEGLQKLLAEEFDLVGTAQDGRELLTAALRLRPDVVLMDISMPRLNGVEAARQLSKRVPAIKIIFVTMHAEKTYVTEAFRAGASGYLLKRSAASELVSAIHQVMNGKIYLTSLIAGDSRGASLGRSGRPKVRPHPHSPGELTARQREVLQLVAEGYANKETAGILGISVKTVEFHKSGIMEKLGLRTTAELTKYALHHGIADNTM